MAKRRATTELNRDNWDAEEEKEDPGQFKKLNDEELKNRVIRKARRSLVNNESSGISPFAAFSGFSKSVSGVNPFNFLNTDVQEDGASSDNISNMEESKEKNGRITISEEKNNESEMTDAKQINASYSENMKPIHSGEYYRQLRSLNASVMRWMQLHLDKNSCCDFTPVFNDYKKHLDTLHVTYPVENNDASNERNSSMQPPVSLKKDSLPQSANRNENYGFSFGSSLKTDDETDYGAHFKSNTTNTSTFSFGIKKTPTATSSMSSGHPTTSLREEEVPEKEQLQFSSGSSNKEESSTEKKSFQFSFGLNNNTQQGNSHFLKPFTFAASSVEKTAESESGNTEDPEYVPPKNDFTTVKEEDAFYSKRCKLFFKKDDAYVERGIGTLHLKPLDGKTQLLIRAETSLGNILLNIILSDSVAVSRTGRNNVLLMCVPNPPIDPKKTDLNEPIPMLIRVKTAEDADELLEALNKHKS